MNRRLRRANDAQARRVVKQAVNAGMPPVEIMRVLTEVGDAASIMVSTEHRLADEGNRVHLIHEAAGIVARVVALDKAEGAVPS